MTDEEAAVQQVTALENIRQLHHGKHAGTPDYAYTNGHCLAYWGSMEQLNGARVIDTEPCGCPRCAGLRVAGKEVTRLVALLELNGQRLRISHCSPSHIH
jgi:hypothetical protein